MKLMIVFLCTFASHTLTAQEVIPLWTQQPPYSKPNSLEEAVIESWGVPCVKNVTNPTLTVHRARGENSGRAMIILPGGGYAVESFVAEGRRIAEYLSSNGIVAAVLKYRLPLTEASDEPHLLPVTDARRALTLMRSKADDYGIDPAHVGIMGFSAGGHLAACTMIPKSVEADGDDLSISTIPQAMVLFNPVLSFENEQLLKRLNGDEQLAGRISPTRHLDKNSPPAIILFGTNDRLKIFGDQYWEKARAIGVRADEFLAEGQGHGFFNRSPWTERTLVAVDKFLASLGYLKGEPTIEVPKETPTRQRRRAHPNTRKWPDLFAKDLSNAIFPEGVWTSGEGILTASEDQAIWTKKDYDNFVLGLDFNTAPGTNSGVVV